MPIDFSQARTPNFFEIYQQSFEHGRALGRQRALQAAMAQYQTDPQAGLEALQRIDLETAARVQRQSSDTQNRNVHTKLALQTLQSHGRREDIEHAAMLTKVLQGLRGVADPAQRLAMAQHLARQFPQFGLSDDDVAGEDLSDSGIDQHIRELSPLASLYRGGAPARNPAAPAQPFSRDTMPDPFSGR
jgi:hypothetical protein